MATLSSSCRATLPSAQLRVGHRSNVRGSRNCLSQSRCALRLVRLAACAVVAVALVSTEWQYVRSVRAAAEAAGTGGADANSDLSSAAHVFDSLEELNGYVYGQPFMFEPVTWESHVEGDESPAGASSSSSSSSSTEAHTAEASPATSRIPLSELTAALQAYTSLSSGAAPSRQHRTPTPTAAAVGAQDSGAAVNVSDASMCSADFTCPRSSVAWASGSFTSTGLLTPHSLALPVRLQLRLSLCCRYKFDGTLLRSREVYDGFLHELLQASPFQVLTPAEKRELFPQAAAYIVDTWHRRRVYNASYTLTEADVAMHNDGDGDVLVLTTGVLRAASLNRVLSSSPALAAAHPTPDLSAGTAPAAGGSGVFDRWDGAVAGSDMQLRITNRVLKCKCPHILTVMPLLHVRRDALPPITIAGLGAHCGVEPTQKGAAAAGRYRSSAAATHRPRTRQVRRADGSVAFATSFQLEQQLPPTTLVSWTVSRVEDAAGEMSRSDGASAGVAGDQQAQEKGGQLTSTPTGVSPPPPSVRLLLRHTQFLPVVTNASGAAQYSSAASPFFIAEPNVRYEIAVTVMRGPLLNDTQLSVLSANDFTGTWTSSISGDGSDGSSRDQRDSQRDSYSSNTQGRPLHDPAAAPSFAASLQLPQLWRDLRVQRSARGRFVLRVPLNRSWELPPVKPSPHFGFHRVLRLHNNTIEQHEVRAALDPHYDPASPPSSSAAADEAEAGSGGGGGWFGLGRWASGRSGAAPVTANRTLAYYGYWEKAPLKDQPIPQVALRVPANPFLNASAASGVTVPLSIGRNLLAYVVRDVDDVCEPVVLEGREVWAVQSLIHTPGPVTSCGEETQVSALVLRELYFRMRAEAKIEVTVPNTSWTVDRAKPIEVAAEGAYDCAAVRDAGAASAAQALCAAVPDTARDGSGTFATLRMVRAGVFDVVWVVRVAVRGAALVETENLDPLYARVLPGLTNTTFVVELRSPSLLVVRRLASYPAEVSVELPMHARRWLVDAPRAAAGGGGGGRSDRKSVDVLTGDVAAGYWRTHPPLRVLSVNERLTAELDTSQVPNVQRTLPNGTLEFVAQDRGEKMSLTTTLHGVRRTFAYTSRCPDTVVAYVLHVVAFPPPPLVPAFAPIYTEEECVVLVPPRAVRKDEVAEWQLPPCPGAASFESDRKPLYLIERTIPVEEQEEHAYVTTAADGGAPLATHAVPTAAATPAVTGNASVTVTQRRPVTALLVCGVAVYDRCEVVWSVRNLVAETHKTFSLRRCQRPPDVLFHKDAQQLPESYPASGLFALPSVPETVYVPVIAPVAAGAGEGENTRGESQRQSSGGTAPSATAAAGAPALMSRQRHHRAIIPIAGHHTSLGYSFNYTGLQRHFEMHLRPLPDSVAHQLTVTQHDYVESDDDGGLVFRRRSSWEVQRSSASSSSASAAGGAEASTSWTATDASDGTDRSTLSGEAEGESSGTFWEDYATRQGTESTDATPPHVRHAQGMAAQRRKQEQQQRERSRQLDQRLEEAYRILHEPAARRLRVADVGNSSLYPMDYVVRGAAAAGLSAEAAEDQLEFARRGMCVERPGHLAVLAVNPRGSVRTDERYGTVLPPPPAPAVAVLPFCAPRYTFARYPELASIYGYDYTWTCPDAAVMTVAKYHPMYSVISHAPETVQGGAAPPPRAAGDAAVNGTLCELRVENHITRTEQREWFLVQRVFPSPLSASLVVVLSDNAATSLQVLPATNARTRPHAAAPASSSSSSASQRRPSGAGRSSAAGEGSSAAAATAVVTMEELYAAPRGTFPFTRARRVVGKSVVLHVDAPSDPSVVQWAVTSIVPAATATVGTQVMMEEVGFELLPRHPAAVARGRGGSTVLITGLRTPGLYTLTHTVPDPANPEVCPPTTLTEMLDVFHARVLERELFVCGDTAALQAVPIPREIAHEFVGQWEVVSLATDAKTVWTAGANFTGIRFERGTRASTLVHGLPFGVVTMRWAIYRLLPPSSSSSSAYNSGTSAAASAASQRELVDFDTVEVYVLTENLPSHRLVTLSNQATLLTTSSTQNWKLVDVHSALHDTNGNVGAAAVVAAGGESSRLAGVRMSHSTVSNYSDGAATLLAEAVGEDAVGQALFHTYYGLQPRPGTGALTLRSLPVGTVYLEYDLVPSRSLFGKMVGHTCALRGHYEVERVSAYLAASTTLDHECDGYSGQGLITLCLVTDAASATSSAGGRATARSTAASSSAGRTHKRAPSSTRGRSAPASAHFWQSQVRLIDPASLEETMKRGAREYEDRSGGRCATPWWVAPTARWSAPAYTAVSAEQWRELSRGDGAAAAAASSSPSSSPTLPGRCVSFRVRAGRHLSPREVAQPLFVAMPRLSSSAAPQGVDGAEGRRRRPGGGSRRSESAFSGGARGDGSGLCPYHGDFITTRIIDGAPLMEGGTVLRATAAASRGGSAAATAASAGSSFFGLSQLFQIGLPHSNTRARETGNDEEEGDGGGAWGIHFLPVLQPHSLRRANATMRPIVGLRGVIDDVTSETNISGLGRAHYSAMEGSSSSSSDDDDTRLRVEMEKDGSAATVLLRLDLTNAKHLGGYVLDASGSPASSSSSSTRFNASESPTIEPTYPTLLHKCVTGTLRGADVLQYWSETNRPDGRVDRTAQEWLDYTLAVRDATVRCDVLFPTLDHLITELYDPAGGSSSSSNSGGGGGHVEKPVPRAGWLYGQQQQQQQRRLPSSTPPPQPWTGSPALPSSQPAHRQPQYVSLAEMEQQVDRIRRQYRWTADGIDVTGLPPPLQNALSHRRITTTQLKAIEAARKARQAAEEAEAAQQQQQLAQRGLQNAPSQLSPTDRLLSALKAYRGVAEGGGEVAVLRIRLPLYEGFAVPYDVYLRTALHKDVVCGSAVEPPPALTDPPAQPTVANPHSLVPLGRLQIRDAPPALSLYPPVVKQCEVEGGLPVLTFELTGATFEGGVYTADDVQLEELANPAVVSSGGTSGGVAPSDIGLAACVAEMRAGLKAVVESGSHRRLYLQLNACPHFKMLTPEEYNERQDSAELLRRLQHSRYLRVTVRRAIKPDSFLSGHGSSAGTAASSSSSSPVRAQGSAATLTTTRAGGASAQLLNTTIVTPTSTDATFVVEVRPTLARLHLRSSAHMAAPPPLPASSSSPSQAQRRRAPEDVETPANAGDEDSSWWSRVIGSTASRRDTPTSVLSSAYAFPPTPTRPLLVCESDLHRYGMQLGIELIGDVWTDPVGEDSPAPSSSGSRVTGSSSGGSSALLPRQRAPPNVALLNSFSVVEHHSLDSSHHLYMKGGGVYRSHFINYLFSTLLSDAALLQRHTFVHRYNDTFVSLVLPPLSALPPSSAAARGGQRYGGQSASPHHHPRQQQQKYSYAQADRATRGVALPSVRQFCKIEEILFAVPGIATECRGCLLADTTFFVAGDLTGVWTATSSSSSSSSFSAAAVAGSGGSSAAATPSDRSRWTSDTFTSPLVLLWDRVGSVPRQWVLEWACPLAAHRALQAMAQQLSSRSDGAGVEVVMDVVLYKLRGLHGEELPAEQRPSVLMSTQPLSLSDVMARNAARVTGDGSAGRGEAVVAAPLELHVNQSGVEAAFTQLHDDVLRHRRRAWTMLDYHRDERYAGGALVVNASVFLKLCATDGVAGAGCTVVSITDALLAVEVPKVSHTSASRSWLRRVLWRSGPNTAASATHGSTASRYTAAPTSVAVLLHHGFMTYLWYDMLPLLGVVTLTAEGGAAVSESYRQDQQRAHIAFAVMGFIFLFFGYAFVPLVWTGLCLVLWSVSIYLNHRPELILLFVASVLYTHYLL